MASSGTASRDASSDCARARMSLVALKALAAAAAESEADFSEAFTASTEAWESFFRRSSASDLSWSSASWSAAIFSSYFAFFSSRSAEQASRARSSVRILPSKPLTVSSWEAWPSWHLMSCSVSVLIWSLSAAISFSFDFLHSSSDAEHSAFSVYV